MQARFTPLMTANNSRFAPGPEGGQGAICQGFASGHLRRTSLERLNNSRPPWGAGPGANRIAGRSGAQNEILASDRNGRLEA